MYDLFYSADPGNAKEYEAVRRYSDGVVEFWHCIAPDLVGVTAGYERWSEISADWKQAGEPKHTFLGREDVLTDEDGGFD